MSPVRKALTRSPLRSLMVAGVAVACTALVAAPAQAGTKHHAAKHAASKTDCTPQGTTKLQNGAYAYQQDEWNSNTKQCATINTDTGAWNLSTASFNLKTNGPPATYPSSFKGCHWGNCTTNSGLPIQVSKLRSATSSWSTTQPSTGAYDVAYDIWFNSKPTATGQPDGTELMIWINSRGGPQPFGQKTGTANLSGHAWNVWTGNQTSWKIISYQLQTGSTSVSKLDVKALIDDSVKRGSLNSAHYLLDSEAGFEVWQGGRGLATKSYSFDAK